MNNKGIIYIAFNNAFVQESFLSAESVKRFMPDIPITLFTDKDVKCDFIDDIIRISPKHIRSKVDYITESPYENTLYLDSDTVVMMDITDMFEVLKRFDVGFVHDYARKRDNYCKIKEYADIPYSFSEVNGGIMSFNNSDNTKEFLSLWQKKFYEYKNATNGWDQVSLRIALWQSNVRIHHYPIEYNVRPSSIRDKVKRNHAQLGESHLEPRIYHMHYDHEVHNGIFNIKSLDDLENIVRSREEAYR